MREEIKKRISLNGVKPSPEDPRDYKLTNQVACLAYTPPTFSVAYPIPNLDQGNINACVWFTQALLRTTRENIQNKKILSFSPGFGYGFREPNQYQGEGFIPSEALANLKKYGMPLLSDFSIIEEVPGLYDKVNAVKDKILPLAKQYRITSYAKLKTVEEYKSALIQGLDVCISVPFYEGWLDTLDFVTGKLALPKPDAVLEGRHMMAAGGWEPGYPVKGFNSWGPLLPILQFPDGYPITEMWSISDTIVVDDPTKSVEWRIIVDKEYTNIDTCEADEKKLEKFKVKCVTDMITNKAKKSVFIIQVATATSSAALDATKKTLDAKKTGFKFKIVNY